MVFDLPFDLIDVSEYHDGHKTYFLKPEVREWLENACLHNYDWQLRFASRDARYIIIHDERVALQFKMTWL